MRVGLLVGLLRFVSKTDVQTMRIRLMVTNMGIMCAFGRLCLLCNMVCVGCKVWAMRVVEPGFSYLLIFGVPHGSCPILRCGLCPCPLCKGG